MDKQIMNRKFIIINLTFIFLMILITLKILIIMFPMTQTIKKTGNLRGVRNTENTQYSEYVEYNENTENTENTNNVETNDIIYNEMYKQEINNINYSNKINQIMLVDDRKYIPDYSFMTNKVIYPNTDKINKIEIINPREIEIFNETPEIDLLFPQTPEPQFFNPVEFPENTSYELKPFTSDTVTNMFEANTISGLYDTINADIYKGYKNNDYML